jgi:hypothetical protein
VIRQRSPLKRSALKPRTKWLARSVKRIRPVNPEAKAKRDARYSASLKSPHAKAQKKMLAIRSGGICECGCEKIITRHIPTRTRFDLDSVFKAPEDREIAEHLRHRCEACSYAWNTPTLDAPAPETPSVSTAAEPENR